MSKFLRHLSLTVLSLIGLSLAINLLVYCFVDPALKTESRRYVQKIQVVEENKGTFDTIFFGSSKVYRQIDSALYDSLTGHKSFNFGIPSCHPPSGTKKISKLVEVIKNSNIKTVFLELSGLGTINGNYNSEEAYYNFTALYELEALLLYLPRSNITDLWNYIQAVWRKYTRGLRLLFYETKNFRNRKLEGHLGFYPLGDELERYHNEGLVLRRQSFLKKPVIHNSGLRRNFVSNINHLTSLYQDYLGRLLNQYKEAGIKVILLISPGSNKNYIYQQYSEFLGENQLPILDFSWKKEYEDLYQVENFFDAFHLNKKGAELYTRLIAEKASEL